MGVRKIVGTVTAMFIGYLILCILAIIPLEFNSFLIYYIGPTIAVVIYEEYLFSRNHKNKTLN